jgi:predicted SprT family Zn-dependent metalloprotease
MKKLPYQKILSTCQGKHKLLYVALTARKILDEHGLQNWKFSYNRRKLHMGLCWHYTKVIQLSKYFVLNNDFDAIHDILMHEIAHALLKPGEQHSPKWQALASKLGATPKAMLDMPIKEHKYVACCKQCKGIFRRYRLPKGKYLYCKDCGKTKGKLRFEVVNGVE